MQWRQGLLGRNQSGFTLVELMIVVVLLSILAIFVTQNTSGLQGVNLGAASKKMQSDLRYAQNLAMTTGDSHGLQVLGPTTYRIYNVVTNAVVESPYDHEPMTENFVEDYLGVNVDVADQAVDIRFNAYGQPTTGAETIQLEIGSDAMSVQVTATSGFVSIL